MTAARSLSCQAGSRRTPIDHAARRPFAVFGQ